MIAEYSTQPPPTNPTINYVATDILQSVRAITNSLGEVTSRRDFMPFGEDLPAGIGGRSEAQKYSITGADAVRQKFTSYQKDQETQLDFAEARMYENRHGRFTAVDPLLASGKSANPQTFNRYVYVLNNPLAYTDPTGLQVGDHKGKVYVNASGTAFSNYEKDGYSLYQGGRRAINAADGWTYAIRQGGWTQVGKTDPNIVDRAAQAVSDTVISGGGAVFSAEIRRAVYTINAIESVQFSLRKVTKTRAAFPSGDAAIKLLWLGLRNAEKKWTMPIANWSLALNQLAIIFEGTVPISGLTENSFTQKI